MTAYSTTHNATNGYYRGAVDGNGFYIILRWNVTQDIQANTSTIQASYILQETNNNFVQYSATTYLRYSTTGSFAAGNYGNYYSPSSTIQYSANTLNTYYWIGNSTLNQETQVDTPPSSAYQWSTTIDHDSSGAPPAYFMIRGYFDSNTNTTYVPEGTIATYDLVANGLIPDIPTVLLTGSSITASVNRNSGTSTLNISSNAVSTNTGSGALYQYALSTDGVTWSNWSTGVSTPSWSVSITAAQKYWVKVRAYTATTSVESSSVTSNGIPSTPAKPTISNVVTTNLRLSWVAPASNGSSITSYTIQASSSGGAYSNLVTGISPSATYYDLTNLTIAATYTFKIIAINSVGSSEASSPSDAQFISAYGYRFTSPTAKTAVVSAARYTGSQSDSIVLGGVTYTGWKQIANVKKYTNGIWGPLER